METATSYSLAFTAGGVTVPTAVAPKIVKEWKKKNPLYSAGTLGVITGAATKSLVELL